MDEEQNLPNELTEPERDSPKEKPSWRTGNRTLVVLAIVAVVSLAAGLGLSRLIVNPAEVAARTEAPPAGPITVPVESRELSNDVMARGDVVFDDAVDLRVETADLGERAVVTGQVPEVGATLDAGSVVLEIAGRPVLVLPGGLPTYRTLRVGVSGPDVTQLKEALTQLEIPVGDTASDVYDSATAAGVTELYRRAGYPAPSASEEQLQAVTDAERAVRSAQAEVTTAEGALAAANTGTGAAAQIAAADAAVRSAQRQVGVAQTMLDECASQPCSATERASRQKDVDDANDAVGVAQAERQALDATADSSTERANLQSAKEGLSDAQTMLADARQETIVALPASEIVYVETLPRRVDAVSVRRGGTVEGAVMSVSGATLQVVASVASTDASLLQVGSEGTIELNGETVGVTVTEIGDPPARTDQDTSQSTNTSRKQVTFQPGDLTAEQVAAFQGQNVRVSIPVSSTGGAVLAVPLAALTAGPGGESRVEVMAEDGTTSLVEVEPGLAAGGYVEITGAGLNEGDLVVVGQNADQTEDENA